MADAKKLGDMLVENGIIDDFQLQTALSHQRNWGGKLGAILIELEFVKEEELVRVISEKLRIPYVNLFEPEVSRDIIKLIKPESAKKYHVMPVKREGNSLVLAMLDPLDIKAIDEIRFITGLTIKPTLAMDSEIKDAIRKYYDGENVVRKKEQAPLYQRGQSDGKMELIHGSDLTMKKASASDSSSQIMAEDEVMKQSLEDFRLRLDALINLLIEKELISREEIVSSIYHK